MMMVRVHDIILIILNLIYSMVKTTYIKNLLSSQNILQPSIYFLYIQHCNVISKSVKPVICLLLLYSETKKKRLLIEKTMLVKTISKIVRLDIVNVGIIITDSAGETNIKEG